MSDFPIIQSSMTIPWSVAEQAFLGYEKKYGRGQSLETIARRGGFGVEELDEYYPEWREHIDLKSLAAEMKGELDGLTQELYDSKYLAARRKKLLRRAGVALETLQDHHCSGMEEGHMEVMELVNAVTREIAHTCASLKNEEELGDD